MSHLGDEQYARLWPQFRDIVSPHGHEQQQSTFFYTTISIIMPFGTFVVIYIMYRLPFYLWVYTFTCVIFLSIFPEPSFIDIGIFFTESTYYRIITFMEIIILLLFVKVLFFTSLTYNDNIFPSKLMRKLVY
jgi:hypothetical protein